MPYKIAIILDRNRIERIRGTPLENLVKDLYGGYLKVLEVEVPDDVAQRILREFPRARIDARGYIEETPVAFKRELFNVIVNLGSVGPDAIFPELLKPERLELIKKLAAKEDEYLPLPQLNYPCG